MRPLNSAQVIHLTTDDSCVPSIADYIVDPSFRDNFLLHEPTRRYAALLETLPDVLVAPHSTLECIIRFMALELSHSFTARGISLPPWRRSKSLLSKWQQAGQATARLSADGHSQPAGKEAAPGRQTATTARSRAADAAALQARARQRVAHKLALMGVAQGVAQANIGSPLSWSLSDLQRSSPSSVLK